MFKENKGQISVEYLFIFAISLIILTVFTIPLANLAIEKTTDVSNALNVKSQLYKIASGINQVYSEGQGAKQSINLELDENVNVNIYRNHLSANVKFNDKSSKLIKVNHDCDDVSGVLQLNKGKNTIIIQWPENMENIIISKKIN
ncbi:class III signal peptide-containing protein [uncultured Methanobrevibacter sp.]|uniref:class III signal peptide-containing protein n=1 Tax=uncultured Methanobrevibacter sp. TaxID=253161 RepID=UPI0026248B29|nr:class III signal peptide-containing protein [uncultured Methanobrevibacter sp.]